MVKQIQLFSNYLPIFYYIFSSTIVCISIYNRSIIEFTTVPLLCLTFFLSTIEQKNPFTYQLWCMALYGTYAIVSSCIYFHEYFMDYIVVINPIVAFIYFILHYCNAGINKMIYMNILLFLLPSNSIVSIIMYMFITIVITCMQLTYTKRKNHKEQRLVATKNTLRLSHILRLHPYFAWLSIFHILIEYKRRFVETQADFDEIELIVNESSEEVIKGIQNGNVS